MDNKSSKTINLIAIFVVVLYVVFSCFSCFEITHISVINIEDTVLKEVVSVRAEHCNIPLALFLAGIQCLLLFIGGRSYRIASLICAIFMCFAVPVITVKRLLESTFASWGGLGYEEFDITLFWYVVILLGILNVIVQIVSLKKEGNEQ